ncbi:MAG: RAMP superfamily CRISPR-associated protein [Lachnospira sp.]
MKKNEFLNPYNFIELPEHKRKQYEDTDRHTGVIEYSITTKTPLFIPNTSTNKAFKISDEKEFSDPEKVHHSYDFYSYTLMKQEQRYDDVYHQPVIPGSEVRGMIRNLYETLTDSCMSGLTVNEIPIKRVPGIFKAGLICKNGENYKLLLNVDSFRIKFREYLPDGKKIYVKKEYKEYKGRNFPGVLTRYSTRPEGPCKSEAYVINWGRGANKKGSHVFIAKSNSSEIKISKKLIEDTLLRVIESYKNQPSVKKSDLNAYKNYESAVKAFLKNNEKGNVYFPVNYSTPIKSTGKNTSVQQGSIVYLSPACITKEAYANTIGKLAGEFAPCKNTNKICPSCALFGTIGEDITSAAASKLRFADLLPEKMQENAKSYYDNIITLQTLGGPKLGNVAFYLKKPDDANFWTYDYYIDQNGDVCIKPGELRGRKYYWHHQNFNYTEGVEATNLNKTIRPVKSGITFKGKIFLKIFQKNSFRN